MKFKHPFTCIVAGPTGSGKTSFVIKLLQNLKSLCKGVTLRERYYMVL